MPKLSNQPQPHLGHKNASTSKLHLQDREHYFRNLALASLIVIAFIASLSIFPIAEQDSKAANCTDINPESCPAKSLSTQAAVEVATTIAVALDPAVRIEVTPTAAGAFSSQAAKLAVSTNSAAGYQLTMTSASGTDALTNTANSNLTIAAVPANTPKANFANNTWGYNLATSGSEISDSTTFSPVPTSATSIKTTSSASNDSYLLNFATKVDSTLPSGEYNNNLIISTIANPRPATIDDITTMQQMTPAVCNSMPLADESGASQYQLTDSRDGKTYYVARIKNRDNDEARCWMAQNLAYDFVKGKVLTPNDSDVTANWTVPDNALAIGTAGGTEATSLSMWKGNNVTSDHDSYGNYYSFGAATAGSGTSLANGETAPNSICPAGWKLPSADDFALLITDVLDDKVRLAPYYIPQSYGVVQTGEMGSIGDASFWLSKVGLFDNAPAGLQAFFVTGYGRDYLRYNGNYTGGPNSWGATIRCIAK